MFEIESKNPEEITIITKKTNININVVKSEIEAGLKVGVIAGPGEFEIGDIAIRGIAVTEEGKDKGRVIYDAEIGGVHIGVLGDIEANLDDLVADVLCTSSVRAVRELSPKMVVATGNVDGMVMELKVAAKTDKKLKVKNLESLPATLEVVALS